MIKVEDDPKTDEFDDCAGFQFEFPPFGPFMRKFAFNCGPHHRRGRHSRFHGDRNWSAYPRAYISRDHEKYTIQVELPGISKENIELEVGPDEIWLEARNEELDKEYRRNLLLRKSIDPTMVKASMKAGLLTITAPLAEKGEKYKVNIDG